MSGNCSNDVCCMSGSKTCIHTVLNSGTSSSGDLRRIWDDVRVGMDFKRNLQLLLFTNEERQKCKALQCVSDNSTPEVLDNRSHSVGHEMTTAESRGAQILLLPQQWYEVKRNHVQNWIMVGWIQATQPRLPYSSKILDNRVLWRIMRLRDRLANFCLLVWPHSWQSYPIPKWLGSNCWPFCYWTVYFG